MPPITLPHSALAWSDFVTGCLAMAAGTIWLFLERRTAAAASPVTGEPGMPSRPAPR